MSKMDELISEHINRKKRAITRDKFFDFIQESLKQVGEINEVYKKFYEGVGEKPAMLHDIETRLEKIKNKYEEYFVNLDEESKTKIVNLEEKIAAIIEYHKKLLEGDDSIKEDIKDSQEKITDFYVYLFEKGDENEKDNSVVKNRASDTKEAIERILEFDKKINEGEEAYRKKIEEAHRIIVEKYKNLYDKDEKGKSKISRLDSDIKKINTYSEHVKDDIKPFINNTKEEITTKKKDIDALLEGATGGSLIEGFLKSKNEYNQVPEYKKIEGNLFKKVFAGISNILIFIKNVLGTHFWRF